MRNQKFKIKLRSLKVNDPCYIMLCKFLFDEFKPTVIIVMLSYLELNNLSRKDVKLLT